jgi:hypothetical protein
MAGTLTLAGLVGLRACFRTLKRWLLVHIGVGVLVLPWIGKYLDHGPEFLSGRLPIRFLLGTPVGFIGGNSLVMLALVCLIAFGIMRQVLDRDSEGDWKIDREQCEACGFLLLWLTLPPIALYVYSWVADPLFGPARYTLFVAPAYLILVALGLSRLSVVPRSMLAMGLAIVSCTAMGPMVYAPDLKADWRDFSKEVGPGVASRPENSIRVLVIVASADPSRNVEVETARYYLPTGCIAITSEEATAERLAAIAAGDVYFAVGSRMDNPVTAVPQNLGPYQLREFRRYPGLIVFQGFP